MPGPFSRLVLPVDRSVRQSLIGQSYASPRGGGAAYLADTSAGHCAPVMAS